jgi:trehalose 6-phosphate phosphatase
LGGLSRAPELLLDQIGTLQARLAGGGPVLVALDFDGTLTEIVDDPSAPGVSPARREVLARVPAPGRWLAIVSGRALADVRQRVGIEGAIYVGNHGLEIDAPGSFRSSAPADAEERLASLLTSLSARMASLPAAEPAIVENKGLTATLHVRPREDDRRHAALGAAIRDAVEEAGFVLRAGKASWEIRPAGAATKGDALRRLIESLPGAAPERTVYIGDDTTDEDAFRVLADGVTARVGPAGVETAAQYRVGSPADVYRFLEILGASNTLSPA